MKAVRPKIDYGDNFPVTPRWDPTIPWRFPNVQIRSRPSALGRVLPWLMLVLGVALGVFLVHSGWRLEVPVVQVRVAAPGKSSLVGKRAGPLKEGTLTTRPGFGSDAVREHPRVAPVMGERSRFVSEYV